MEKRMDKIKMDDFSSHWKATLLGEDFWKDAEQYNRPVNDSIEADHSLTLHTRFPFNLGPEAGPRTTKTEEIPQKRRRRFSMSDALGLSSNTTNPASSLPPARFFDIGRGRSRSRSRSPSVASERHTSSVRRTPFNMASSRKNDSIECILATPVPHELGTPSKPLMFFRGGVSWTCLDKNMTTLGLDLFWPVKKDKVEDDDEEKDVLPIEELMPLCQFRRLRVLKITGMMQSYQKYIWQAVWLNTNLEELELGMALQPRIRQGYAENWPLIKGGWKLNKIHYGEPVYFGNMGDGNLDRKIGIGEYLDKTAMEKAKIRAMAMGRTLNRFSIRKLTLTGFVVDADPFLHWFDPKRMRCINFKNDCVDAGFYLCLPMKKVTILYPREVHEQPLPVRRVNMFKELKVVELKGGKKVGEIPYRGPESLQQDIVPKGKENQPINAVSGDDIHAGMARFSFESGSDSPRKMAGNTSSPKKDNVKKDQAECEIVNEDDTNNDSGINEWEAIIGQAF